MNKKKQTKLLTQQEALDDRKWFLLDAEGMTLGRFASAVAQILRGKHKITFTSHIDGGDGVVIINAEKIKVTGAKEAQKIYRYHTGAMSGLREVPYRVMKARKPDYILRNAIAGMMPQSRLARQQLKKLRIFAGAEHDMQAQNPIPLKF
ncbi:MAG TPA: 50S ribosomal protein L13 [Rhabdochlamydiaceae bacterium]|jgi:large subunit ribosomal protein L13|nr:50S ribosomal protein L13 [Rhabdochlamydiaceae bacterium]